MLGLQWKYPGPQTLGRRAAKPLARCPASSKPLPSPDENAAAFQAPLGQKPFWWHEKFEKQRQQLQSAEVQQESQASGTSPQSQNQQPDHKVSTQQQQQQQQQGARRPLAAFLQYSQLAVVLAALILWPAATQPGGLYCLRVWVLYLLYFNFFAASVARNLKHGPLTDRSKDRQRATWGDRLALIAFIITVVLLHWRPVIRFVTSTVILTEGVTLYDVLGFCCMALGTLLNRAAAAALGQAWDRVSAPEKLVTTGVYAHVQHPIYTSYMLLFLGYALMLHSAPTALALLVTCGLYYSRRTALEAGVLREAFGENYEQWASRTRRFIPWVL